MATIYISRYRCADVTGNTSVASSRGTCPALVTWVHQGSHGGIERYQRYQET